jgi:ribosomal protein L37E
MPELDLLSVSFEDRCDRCGAQSFHVAHKGDLKLSLCSHHERKLRKPLFNQGWEIIHDEESIDRMNNVNRFPVPV